MAEIMRVKIRWQNFNGAPGYTNLHFRDSDNGGDFSTGAIAAQARAQAFANGVKQWLGYNVQLQVLPEVEIINDATGQLVNVEGTPSLPVVTSGASVIDRYAAAAGAVVTWRTAEVHRGRRIKGRTFLVPLTGNAYDSNGTLHGDSLGAFNAAAAALRDNTNSPDLGVWARPSAKGASDGRWAVVTSHSVPDMSAVLRSRRD